MISKQVIILEDFNNCQIISDINFAFYKCPNTVVDITIVYGRYPNAAMNHCIFLQNPVVGSNFKNLNSLDISPTFSKQKQRTETYSYHHIFMFFVTFFLSIAVVYTSGKEKHGVMAGRT